MQRSFLVWLLVGIIVVLTVVVGFLFLEKNKSTSISGTLDLNGQPPQGSTITFMQRAVGQGDFSPFLSGQTPTDVMKWSFTKAVPNTNYEIKAVITQGSQTLDTSEILTVTAPSTGSVTRLNYNTNDPSRSSPPPPAPAASPIPTPTPQQTTVTGKLDINGYIPTGALVTLEERLVGTELYQTIGTPFQAADGVSWVWKEALVNNEYNIRAVITDASGNPIGTSNPIAVSAPAANEVLILNSTAVQPTPVSTAISGSLVVNGVVPGGSTVVILQSAPGQSQYQTIVSSLSPTTGTTWSWGGATSGTQYQIQAALKASNGNVLAVSPTISVSAPASNEVLTLNSNYSLPAPTNLPSITCGAKNSSNNTWSATINYNTIPGAQTYWIQLGSTQSGYDLINTTIGPNNATYATANATLNDSITYYARYAYSMSPGATPGSNFSAFSPTQPVKCP